MSEREMVRDIIFQYPTPVIFEIGMCGIGETMWFKSLSPKSTIHCFEPDPRNIEKILASDIGKIPNIHFNPIAVGGKNGMTKLYLSGGRLESQPIDHNHTASSSIKAPTNKIYEQYGWLKFEGEVEVEVVTLDTYCYLRGIEKINILWADVQGAEMDIINGATEILKNTDYIFMEHDNEGIYDGAPSYDKIISSLNNFEVIQKFNNDVLLKNKKL